MWVPVEWSFFPRACYHRWRLSSWSKQSQRCVELETALNNKMKQKRMVAFEIIKSMNENLTVQLLFVLQVLFILKQRIVHELHVWLEAVVDDIFMINFPSFDESKRGRDQPANKRQLFNWIFVCRSTTRRFFSSIRRLSSTYEWFLSCETKTCSNRRDRL